MSVLVRADEPPGSATTWFANQVRTLDASYPSNRYRPGYFTELLL